MKHSWLIGGLDHSGSFSRNHLQKTSKGLPLPVSPNSASSEVTNWSNVAIGVLIAQGMFEKPKPSCKYGILPVR